MDDFYLSSNDKENLIRTSDQVRSALAANGFPLRKWISNDSHIQTSLDPGSAVPVEKDFEHDDAVIPAAKVLGMIWDCKTDTITFRSRRKLTDPPEKVREALRILASTYDPLGIIAPFVFKGKKIWQNIWYKAQDYNKLIPPEQAAEFHKWMQGLQQVKSLSIPRWLGLEDNKINDLHIATDASIEGMAAVAYVVQRGGQSAFMAAKTRVTPPKDVGNVPRLELHAFLLGSRLMSTLLEEALRAQDSRCHFVDRQRSRSPLGAKGSGHQRWFRLEQSQRDSETH